MALTQVVFAACPYPENVIVPDGATATTDDMENGQTRIKQYMAEMEAYLDCLDQEEANLMKLEKVRFLEWENDIAETRARGDKYF